MIGKDLCVFFFSTPANKLTHYFLSLQGIYPGVKLLTSDSVECELVDLYPSLVLYNEGYPIAVNENVTSEEQIEEFLYTNITLLDN